jgi:Zn-dependent protease with chaperone function
LPTQKLKAVDIKLCKTLIKNGLLLFFIFQNYSSPAQVRQFYPYYSTDTLPAYNLALERKNAVLSNIIHDSDARNVSKKDFENEKKEIANWIFSEVRYYALIDTIIEPYVREVFNKVKRNFSLGDKCNIVIVRSPMVNAMSLGDGTIFIYTGLFSVLDNEDQLAYILAHELSHIELKHTTKSLLAGLDKSEEKELKRQIKKTLNEKYEVNKKLYELLLKSTLSYTFHSRNDELQTDSLAFIKFKNSGYDLFQAPSALMALDRSKNNKESSILNLDKHFNCQNHNYNFKAEPVVINSIFEIQDSENIFNSTDTLSTHPDPVRRAGILEEMLSNLSIGKKEIRNDEKFFYVKDAAKIQDVQAYFRNEFYDMALYNALWMLEKYPESHYLQSVVILSLHQMKRYMKKHEFSQVVLKLSKQNPDDFNHLLDMLFNLRLKDFSAFANCFKEKTLEPGTSNEYSLAVHYAFAELNDDKNTSAKLMEEYLEKYPKGFLSFVVDKPADSNKKKKK